jgi:hypothetical protein
MNKPVVVITNKMGIGRIQILREFISAKDLFVQRYHCTNAIGTNVR